MARKKKNKNLGLGIWGGSSIGAAGVAAPAVGVGGAALLGAAAIKGTQKKAASETDAYAREARVRGQQITRGIRKAKNAENLGKRVGRATQILRTPQEKSTSGKYFEGVKTIEDMQQRIRTRRRIRKATTIRNKKK